MRKHSPVWYFKTSPEVIRLAVMIYDKDPVSLRLVEDLLHECDDICHETVRFWWQRFATMFALKIRKRHVEACSQATDGGISTRCS